MRQPQPAGRNASVAGQRPVEAQSPLRATRCDGRQPTLPAKTGEPELVLGQIMGTAREGYERQGTGLPGQQDAWSRQSDRWAPSPSPNPATNGLTLEPEPLQT